MPKMRKNVGLPRRKRLLRNMPKLQNISQNQRGRTRMIWVHTKKLFDDGHVSYRTHGVNKSEGEK